MVTTGRGNVTESDAYVRLSAANSCRVRDDLMPPNGQNQADVERSREIGLERVTGGQLGPDAWQRHRRPFALPELPVDRGHGVGEWACDRNEVTHSRAGAQGARLRFERPDGGVDRSDDGCVAL